MLILATNTKEYFREALEAALKEAPTDITDETQVYLVHLLNQFSHSEQAFAGTGYKEQITVADLFERANNADNKSESLRIYKHLGDISLYLLGFFKEERANKIVSLTYYNDMGAIAYANAASISRSQLISSAHLFNELSVKFSDLVALLEAVADYKSQFIKV